MDENENKVIGENGETPENGNEPLNSEAPETAMPENAENTASPEANAKEGEEKAEGNAESQAASGSKINLSKDTEKEESVPNQEEGQQADPPVPPAPQPKKMNTKIIIAVAALVVVVAGIFFATSASGNPKEMVFKAVEATNEEFAKGGEDSFESITGVGAAFENLSKDSFYQKGNIEFTEIPASASDMSTLIGAGLNFESRLDRDKKQLDVSVGATLSGTEILGFNMFADENTLYAAIPALFSGYLSVPTHNIADAYNSSMFSQVAPFPYGDDFSLDFFTSVAQKEASKESENYIKEVYDRYKTENKALLDSVYEKITVEKADAKDIEIGGTKESCKGYKMVIAPEDAKSIITSIFDFIENDADIQKGIKIVSEAAAAQNSGYSYDASFYESNFKMVISQMRQYFDELKINQLEVTYYLSGKSFIAGASTALGITTPDDLDLTMKFDYELTGKQRPMDGIKMNGTISDGIETIQMNMVYDKTNTDQELNYDFSLDFTDGIETISFIWNSGYNKDNGAFDFLGAFDMDKEGRIELKGEGTLTVGEKGKTFSAIFDDVSFGVDEGYGMERLGFSGEYSIDKLDKTLEVPTNNVMPLFEMNQQEFMGFFYEVYQNLDVLQNTLGIRY